MNGVSDLDLLQENGMLSAIILIKAISAINVLKHLKMLNIVRSINIYSL